MPRVNSAMPKQRRPSNNSSSSTECPLDQFDEPAFGSHSYWDEGYSQGIYQEPLDWVCDWPDVASDITRLIPDRQASVLLAGCGNAMFQIDMHDAGYTGLVCADYSSVVIRQMEKVHSERQIEWAVVDCTSMPYADGSFDAVIDKSLLDCLHCCENGMSTTHDYLNEVHRVLRPGGQFVRLSFHTPQSMKAYMRGWDWKIETCVIDTAKQAVTSELVLKQHSGRSPRDSVACDVDLDALDTKCDNQHLGPHETGTGGLLSGNGDSNMVTLCTCTKGDTAITDDLDTYSSFMATSKKNRKKAAKNKRRVIRMLES